MNYILNNPENKNTVKAWSIIKSLSPLIEGEKRTLLYAVGATFFNVVITLTAPLIIAYILDTYILKMNFNGVFTYVFILFALYIVGLVTSYFQTRLMGGVGQRILFKLREKTFAKLQELPVSFFNVNKTGDLISRINNDTDKLNQFFSQTLVQLVGSLASMFGATIFILFINFKLSLVALAPAMFVLIFTIFVSPWVKKNNAEALKANGDLTAEIAENINNFKIVVAFNRRDFFKERFAQANEINYIASMKAGIANNILAPIFNFSSNIAQLIVLAYGIYLISNGSFTLGLLVSFLSYINSFYSPLRQLAGLWSNFQVALAGWDRIYAILQLKSNLPLLPKSSILLPVPVKSILNFNNVSFSYNADKEILHKIQLELCPGKTYALVGPTGGGKSTTASLMARLYDPTDGIIMLDGQDIRTYTSEERANIVGFILQEPILFSGTIRENLLYGNTKYKNYSNDELKAVIKQAGLDKLLDRFEDGLEREVVNIRDSLSLGQKQLIAFMRIVLREPKLLILDEATANIDTVTEKLLEDILNKLPATTTRVIIAHRLNTIESADEIFFINSGTVTKAGSLQDAIDMLQTRKRTS